MFAWLKAQVMSFLSIPPEPHAPAGSPSSLLVLRASPGYWRYQVALWGVGRLLVLVMSLFLAAALLMPAILVASKLAPRTDQRSVEPEPMGRSKKKTPFDETAPGAIKIVFAVAGSLGLLWFVGQSAVSYVLMRLDYELRWYKVTDRSLRIREGVWEVKEMTMSFANIQNISLSQGPVQKFFGVADLIVESAGGGAPQPGVESLHRGYFRGVDSAEKIRDMMQERLRALKDGGLGDHEDRSAHRTLLAQSPAVEPETVATEASALLEEARAFRTAAERLEQAMSQR